MRGTIPNEIDELSSLTTVSLTNGNIKGSIPETLYNITSLKVIEFSGNSMKGKLSDRLYSLLSLKVLNLNDNDFTGAIQPNIKDLKSLKSLQLHNNKFSGNIRREFKDLSNLGKFCNKISPNPYNLNSLCVLFYSLEKKSQRFILTISLVEFPRECVTYSNQNLVNFKSLHQIVPNRIQKLTVNVVLNAFEMCEPEKNLIVRVFVLNIVCG